MREVGMMVIGDPELMMLDEMARDFAARELEDRKEECDRYPYSEFFEDVVRKALEVGFFSITLPEELEGGAMGVRALSLVLQDISRCDASLAAIIFTNALAQEVLLAAGAGDELAARGGNGSWREALLAFASFDDPSRATGSVATAAEGGWRLSGKVDYLVLGGLAARALLPAATDGGFSFFLVDLSAEGCARSEPILSLGMHSCPAVDVTLDRVPGKLVGRQGAGAEYWRQCADRMNIAAAAISAGIMRGCFDEALDYCRQRYQGGRQIIDWSEVRRMLADVSIPVQVSSRLVADVCRSAEAEEPGWRLSARAAALHVQSLACDVTTDGIQLLGGNGYMEDYGQEKRFRDAKQAQALLGMAPVRKLDYVKRVIDGEL